MQLQKNRKELFNFLLESQPIVLLTRGRTGSDLLQSLLDSHSEILGFNGHMLGYYRFWKNIEYMRKNINCTAEDIAFKFVCEYMPQLKSYYDEHERKHMLGNNRDQSLVINIRDFVYSVCLFLEDFELNSKNFLVAIYAAYSEALGQDLTKKHVLFHHMHHIGDLSSFIQDFPNTKVISMTRDPRGCYYSGIYHRMRWYKDYKLKSKVMTCNGIYVYLKRIFIDSSILKKYKVQYTSIRIEDLGRKEILKKISNWIGIDYENCMTRSTWGGLHWGG